MAALTTEFHPAQQAGSKRLLIVLHGLGDSVAGYRWMPSMLKIPWFNYLLVNAPDDYYGGFSWYDFEGESEPGILRSRRMLFDLLDAQQAAGYPADQISLFGFSQGCLMTLEVGLYYPKKLAGFVGVSGHAHEPERAIRNLTPVAREQRFLVTHGLQDPVISIAAVRPQIRMLQEAGLKIEYREFLKTHTIAGEVELDLIREFLKAGYNSGCTAS